ncbi:hypothetical protein BK634_25665 [Pseudomonas chlororaphis]|nr:hypothetical protein BK634_25665 [Pseudomonas chlororaphis]
MRAPLFFMLLMMLRFWIFFTVKVLIFIKELNWAAAACFIKYRCEVRMKYSSGCLLGIKIMVL